MFGAQQSSSAFGTPQSTPAFGTPQTTPAFGTPQSTPAFGTPQSTPAFGTPSSTPAFGTPSASPAFGNLSTPAFGTPSTSSFATGFGSSLFSTPFSSQPSQQQQSPLFQQRGATGFGFQTPFAAPQSSPFPNAQLITQMAPVAPLPFCLADRDIQAIVEAYKDDAGNPKYAFKHLLFSVTDPQYRAKPAGVSDTMWAEAMAKLEGMESADRERLWPQLVQGFKDLSQRLKIQDEVILADAERLRMTQSNVKMLQRHFLADTLPWVQRLKQKEQGLQRRLLRVMRIVEALESKGCRVPVMKGEAELAEKLSLITRQFKESGAELSRRVQNLLMITRGQPNGSGAGNSIYLQGSAKIHEQSLADMQEVLQQQTEAIARLGTVLKRDVRDMKIIMAEDKEMTDDPS
ncbi:nuclear pore complex protein NUP54-like [Cucurbita maxima]|uniref:Nuclear pore complex protein NUP54-like n=1 Tax=Cucurbita maxima TaxID=3661 RepID=A0A6J1KFN7_CUCMA|nr:nuclear pore complex protein NUP54-like [Cucurbita maxima]